MADKNDKKKKSFNWEPGATLKSDDYEPVEAVREAGFTKIADGILADPTERKKQRKAKLVSPLRHQKSDAGFFNEQSASGLSDRYTPTDASKLINKDQKGFRGIHQFESPKKDKK